MDEKMVKNFLKVIGWDAGDLKKIEAKPKANVDEDPEKDSETDPAEVKAESETSEKVVANKKGDPEPEPTPAISEEIQQLGILVKDIGGVDNLKALLVNVATNQAQQITSDEAEVAFLSEVIANHSDGIEKEDLTEVKLPVLRKMAAQYQVPMAAGVDYSLLGSGQKENKEDSLERPSFFFANRAEKEKEE